MLILSLFLVVLLLRHHLILLIRCAFCFIVHALFYVIIGMLSFLRRLLARIGVFIIIFLACFCCLVRFVFGCFFISFFVILPCLCMWSSFFSMEVLSLLLESLINSWWQVDCLTFVFSFAIQALFYSFLSSIPLAS